MADEHVHPNFMWYLPESAIDSKTQ